VDTYSITQVKYYKQTRKLEKSAFSMLFLKTLKDVKFTVDGSACLGRDFALIQRLLPEKLKTHLIV